MTVMQQRILPIGFGWRFLFLQAVWVVMCLDVSFFANELDAMMSVWVGGCAVIIPQVLFVLIYFRRSGAQHARKIAQAFYYAEAVKLFATFVLMGLGMMYLDLNAIWLSITVLGAYFAALWIPAHLHNNPFKVAV
ncbi:MAG: hypothetical protein CMF51_05065 [Legionellales bacterium]|nr:hypothetical protein [Legionellales bacterium]|tara:strand:- start:1075 stop:1479 length:405 start_codon:yes stop_codon:yes gene_type:complete